MITCPDCSAILSSDGSFRVHKHRYHRKTEQVATPSVVVPEPKPESKQEPTFKELVKVLDTPSQEQQGSNETLVPSRSWGMDGGTAIAGAVGLALALGVAWWFKNRKPPQW